MKTPNVFSFCVYGAREKYCRGMVRNLDLINAYFPDFGVIIYLGNDVSQSYIDYYESFPHVYCIKTKYNDARLRVYRFYPIDNPNIECMIVRDADSRIHPRDRWCIDEFLDSDKKLHLIRDHILHFAKIMAGMWAAKKGCFDTKIEDLYKIWISNNSSLLTANEADQMFLEQVIYHKVKKEIMLIQSNLIGYFGERVSIIPDKIFTDKLFVGAVFNFENGEEIPDLGVTPYSLVNHVKLLQSRDQFNLMDHLIKNCNLDSLSDNDRNYLLDTWYVANYHLHNFKKCQEILERFKSTYVTDHNVRNSNHLLGWLNKQIVGTTILTREPAEDEIVIYYGDYSLSYINLPFSNKIYRHSKYFDSVKHDIVDHPPQ